MVFPLERIWHSTWAGVLLRMQNLHFTTNDTCRAPRLANLALESNAQQTTFVAPRLANLALKSIDGLMKKKH